MATPSDQEAKTNGKMAEAASSSPRSQDSDVCEGATAAEPGRTAISMFCKACLHPYSGERKAGTLVLKCERCGQTDVILEGDAPDLKPEQWCGNLMMNRFLKVLKEQEDLCLNIADPFFEEDDYQRLHLAIAEYTFNMKAIAERMYEIAKNATSTLAEYYENKAANEEDGESESTEVPIYVLPQAVRQQLKHLGTTVLRLMEDLVKKYGLPMDILDKVRHRLAHPGAAGDGEAGGEEGQGTADNEEGQVTTEQDNDGTLESSDKSDATAVSHPTPAQDSSESEKNVDQVGKSEYADGENIIQIEEGNENEKEVKDVPTDNNEVENAKNDKPDDAGVAESNADEEGIKDAPVKDQQENDKLDAAIGGDETVIQDTDTTEREDPDKADSDSSEDYVIFNVTKARLEQEVFDALAHKFALKFDSDAPSGDTTKEAQTTEANAAGSAGEETTDNSNEDQATNDVKESDDKPTNPGDSDFQKAAAVLTSVDSLRTFVLNTTSDDPNEEPAPEARTDDDVVEVNFYAVSSAFITELGERKRVALLGRKDRALATVNEKIAALKREVERVEDTVKDELTLAYERKRRKVENQRRQLDERHQQIQDAEQLLDYYARTGQTDKLAELMEQLNVQYEN